MEAVSHSGGLIRSPLFDLNNGAEAGLLRVVDSGDCCRFYCFTTCQTLPTPSPPVSPSFVSLAKV